MHTLIYAFGTSSLSVSSQALWQHGPAQLALAAAIYCLIRARDDARWAGYAGLPLAFEVITRPADALIAAPLGLYVLISYRREVWRFVAAASAPLLFQLWYSATYFGSPLRIQFFTQPTSVGGQTIAPGGLWTTSLANGLAVALLSPGRGLLFYSPIVIFSFAGLALAWRRNGDVLLRYLGVGAILSIMLAAKWHKTSGGDSFGPRLLADITPIMALALFPLADPIRNRRGLQIALVALGLWSVTANLSGAFISYRGWDQWALDDADRRLWLWGDNPVVDPFRSTLDSIRIVVGRRPTSRNSPDLLDALLVVLQPPPHDVVPNAHVHVSLRAANIGKAVWLARSRDDRGMVSLGWEWKRGGKVVADSEVRRELHLNVFPGDSMELDASAPAPDASGDYEMEISLAAEVTNQTMRTIGLPVTVPVTVAPPAEAPAGVR
jgi:hypothetical protein